MVRLQLLSFASGGRVPHCRVQELRLNSQRTLWLARLLNKKRKKAVARLSRRGCAATWCIVCDRIAWCDCTPFTRYTSCVITVWPEASYFFIVTLVIATGGGCFKVKCHRAPVHPALLRMIVCTSLARNEAQVYLALQCTCAAIVATGASRTQEIVSHQPTHKLVEVKQELAEVEEPLMFTFVIS